LIKCWAFRKHSSHTCHITNIPIAYGLVRRGFKTSIKSSKFNVFIWNGLRQVKRTSSKPKSERYFWINTGFKIGNISNIKNGEPIPVNQFSDLVTQTYRS
jgi:hypothetical protein